MCICQIYCSQVLSREWRCSWSSADRRCSNYIWVINNLMAYEGASYIRDSTVYRSMPALLVRGIIFTYNLIHRLDAYHTIDMQAALFMNSTHRYARMLCVALAILRFSSSACMTMSTWNRGCKHRIIKLDWDSKVKPTGVWHCCTKSPQSLQWRLKFEGLFTSADRMDNTVHTQYYT